MCGKCHDLSNVVSNASWNQHGFHINTGFTCSVCHTAHGMGARSGTISGERLVNFDINVVAANGSIPVSYTRATNTCILVCHMAAHNADGSVTQTLTRVPARTRARLPRRDIDPGGRLRPVTEQLCPRIPVCAKRLFPARLLSVSHSVPVQVAALLLLFTMAAWYESAHLSALADPDVWWHLSTGNWILQNHAVPHGGLFSQYSTLPWTDSSWLFDVLLAAPTSLIGLRALPVLLMAFKVAIAVVTFVLARGSRLNFWPAVFLAAAAQYAMPSLPPGPVVCSIVLFAIELNLLFGARRTGNVRPLFWLPLLFLLWVNLDVGLCLGCYCCSCLAWLHLVKRLAAVLAGLSTGQSLPFRRRQQRWYWPLHSLPLSCRPISSIRLQPPQKSFGAWCRMCRTCTP
jgi:hypothetical protein